MEDTRQVLQELVVARGAALKRSAFLLCGSDHAADDLLQEALARVLSRRVPGGRDGLEAYVRRTMVNLVIDQARRARRWQSVAPRLAGRTEEEVADSSDEICERVTLLDALALLSPRQRACVVLHYYEDLSIAETAELLGCRQGTVKSQLHDARRTLSGTWAVLAYAGSGSSRADAT